VQARGGGRSTDLDVVIAGAVRDIRLDAEVGQRAILAHAARLIREWIRTRDIRQVILTNETVRRKQRLGAQYLRVRWSNLEGVDVLVLRLAQCGRVKRVRHVERRPRRLQVHVQRAGASGPGIGAVEEGHLVARVVNGLELG